MGKIYANFYPQVCDLFNLWQAFVKASKGRRSHPSIAAFEYNLEPELIRLRDELRDETYKPGGYRSFTVHEPKRRKISAAPFRDRENRPRMESRINECRPSYIRLFVLNSWTVAVVQNQFNCRMRRRFSLRALTVKTIHEWGHERFDRLSAGKRIWMSAIRLFVLNSWMVSVMQNQFNCRMQRRLSLRPLAVNTIHEWGSRTLRQAQRR